MWFSWKALWCTGNATSPLLGSSAIIWGKQNNFQTIDLPVGLGQCGLMVFSKRLPVVFKKLTSHRAVAACEPGGYGTSAAVEERFVGDVKVSGSRLFFACRTSLLRYDSYGKTIYCHREAAMREEYEICCSLSRKHTVYPNDRFIIFTLSSNTEGCIRDLPFSALNNLSRAATCEIIELTRIYSSRWSFFFLLGLWVMTIRVTTWAWCKMYMFISFSFFTFILFYDLVQL